MSKPCARASNILYQLPCKISKYSVSKDDVAILSNFDTGISCYNL